MTSPPNCEEVLCDSRRLCLIVTKRTQIFLNRFSGNVDHGLKNRRLHFGVVLDSRGTLTFDLPKLKRPKGFDHKATCCVMSAAILLPVEMASALLASTVLTCLNLIYTN